MIIDVKINNIPDDFDPSEPGYIVVRLVNADLWWFGFYGNEKRATQAALEIGNGVVLKTVNDD